MIILEDEYLIFYGKVDKTMKKPLFLVATFFMITSLLGGCTLTKTEEKKDKEISGIIQSDKDVVEEEKTEEEVLQGNYVKNEIEEGSGNNVEQEIGTQNEIEENADNAIKQEKVVEGYVLEAKGNIIIVDLENSGGRNYPEEGLDRGVEFDITNAEKEVIPTSGYLENRECRIRTGLTVSITYYEEKGKNVVTKISTDNDEKEMIVYVSSGQIQERTDETIKIHVNEGDNNGESIVFNVSKTSMPQEANVNSLITVTYYMKENTYYALSVSCIVP